MKTPILFPIMVITLMVAIHYLFYTRVIKRLDISKPTRTLLTRLVIFNFLGILGYIASRYFLSVPDWLYFMLSLSFGVVLLFVVIGIAYEILHLFQTKAPFDASKRAFFKRSSDVSILALGGGYITGAIYGGQQEPVVVDVKVDQKLFDTPYRIVQISDMHIGGLIQVDFVKKAVERINALKPDFVVITGDLTDAHIDTIQESVAPLQNLQSRLGSFYVVGNHEYFHGLEDTVAYIKTLNITVLENTTQIIGDKGKRFNIAGLYDYFGYRVGEYVPNIDLVKQAVDSTIPTLLLMHQPRQIKELEGFKPNLMLSGHTHGGQIFPFNYLVTLQQPYIKGLHQLSPKKAIYINSGIGFWGPKMRLGSTAEITLIEWS
ncbi:MAG: metallophosphoesterase [Campylobacterales bacterium]|nr:metallophosphoesterase [Campylobacterales bacterium]